MSHILAYLFTRSYRFQVFRSPVYVGMLTVHIYVTFFISIPQPVAIYGHGVRVLFDCFHAYLLEDFVTLMSFL